MYRVLALACLLLLALTLAGCGGGGSAPVLVAGEYFPLTLGTTWTYDMTVEIETATGVATTSGTFVRDLAASVPITINGNTVQASEVSHTATLTTVPDVSDIATARLAKAINYLCSPTGGMQPLKAYYRQLPASGNLSPRLALLALAENGGAVTALPHTAPFLLNPTYQGAAQTVSGFFVPLPLRPPTADMTGLTVHDKLLDYGDVAGLNGLTHSVISIYYFSSDVTLDGVSGKLAGRGRTYLLDGLGFASGGTENCEWAGTLQVGGEWARITVTCTLASLT